MNDIKINILILLLLPFFCLLGYEDSDKNEQNFITYPKAYSEGQFNSSVGLSLTVLPRVVFEDEVSHLPMIYFKMRYGLPYNLSLTGKLSTIYYTNQASIGIIWSYNQSNIFFSPGFEWGQWYGFMNMDGLSVKSRGSLIYPSITFGFQISQVLLSVKGELLIQSQKTSVDGEAIGKTIDGTTGIAVSFIVEQPLWNNNFVTGEIKLNFTKFYYQTWLSYSTFDKPILYPEILFGFNL